MARIRNRQPGPINRSVLTPRPRQTVGNSPSLRFDATVGAAATVSRNRRRRVLKGQDLWATVSPYYRTAATHDIRWSA